jgi:hypothetical protein
MTQDRLDFFAYWQPGNLWADLICVSMSFGKSGKFDTMPQLF